MTIAWASFTPWSALAGGVLIGLASALLLLGTSRIAGISGILASAIDPGERDGRAWRVAFLIGLVVAPLLYVLTGHGAAGAVVASPVEIVIGGFLVGLGTRYAGGCTSGHGVCGLSRFSPRSLVATASFMGAGFATVFVVRHWVAS